MPNSSYLKLEELSVKARCVDEKAIGRIANEDQWIEFVPINLGHWDSADLRKMSEDVGLKDLYDSTLDIFHQAIGNNRVTTFDFSGPYDTLSYYTSMCYVIFASKMSKVEYDKYYDYSSGFVHGNWGAIRESVYQKCVNPMHRLHRLPQFDLPLMPSIVDDARDTANGILECLAIAYPAFSERIKAPLASIKESNKENISKEISKGQEPSASA